MFVEVSGWNLEGTLSMQQQTVGYSKHDLTGPGISISSVQTKKRRHITMGFLSFPDMHIIFTLHDNQHLSNGHGDHF